MKISYMTRLEWRVFNSYVLLSMMVLALNLRLFGLSTAIAIYSALGNGLIMFIVSIPIFKVTRYLSIDKFKYVQIIISHVFFSTLYAVTFYGLKYVFFYFYAGAFVAKQSLTQIEWQIWGTYTTYCLLCLSSYFIQYIIKLKEKDQIEIELRKAVQTAQLEALRYQLNPHFLFNSLNNINSLISSDPEKSREMLVLLSDFLREAINRDNLKYHSIKKELIQIERYLQIEKIRFEENLQIDIKNYVRENFEVPPLILQPLIENVIKHGITNNSDLTKINIKVSETDDFYIICIFNTTENPITDINFGTGLSNVEKRLTTNYSIDLLMEINKESGFEVRIKIPK